MSTETPSLHLVSHHLCPYVQRAAIMLCHKAIDHRRSYIDLAAKPDWFLALSPLGRTPVLVTPQGALFESQVIVDYLDEVTPGSLFPEDSFARARQRAWIAFGSETLAAIAALYSAADAAAFEAARGGLRGKLERIEREVIGPFFDGPLFQMIDGVWGTVFRYFDVLDDFPELRLTAGLERVGRWRRQIAGVPAVAAAAPADYASRLRRFLATRPSHLGQRVGALEPG